MRHIWNRVKIGKSCPGCGGAVAMRAVLGFSGLAGIACPHCGSELQVPPLLRIVAVLLSLAIAQAAFFLPPEMVWLRIAARPALLVASYVIFTWLLARLRVRGAVARPR